MTSAAGPGGSGRDPDLRHGMAVVPLLWEVGGQLRGDLREVTVDLKFGSTASGGRG